MTLVFAKDLFEQICDHLKQFKPINENSPDE